MDNKDLINLLVNTYGMNRNTITDREMEEFLTYKTTYTTLKRHKNCFENQIRNNKPPKKKYDNINFEDLVSASQVHFLMYQYYTEIFKNLEHDLKNYMNEIYQRSTQNERVAIRSIFRNKRFQPKKIKYVENTKIPKFLRKIKFLKIKVESEQGRIVIQKMSFQYGNKKSYKKINNFYDLFTFATIHELLDIYNRIFVTRVNNDRIVISNFAGNNKTVLGPSNILFAISKMRNRQAHCDLLFLTQLVDVNHTDADIRRGHVNYVNNISEFIDEIFKQNLVDVSGIKRSKLDKLLKADYYNFNLFYCTYTVISLLSRNTILINRKNKTLNNMLEYLNLVSRKISDIKNGDQWIYEFKSLVNTTAAFIKKNI